MAVDLDQVCKQLFDRAFGGDLKGINLNRLRVEATDSGTTWSNESITFTDTQQAQITVERLSTTQGAHSLFGNANTSVITTECELEQTYLKGLNTPLKVPLPESLSSSFGNSLEVNLGSRRNSGRAQIPYQVTSTRPYGQNQNSDHANLYFQTVTGKGNFSCRVKLSGKVIFQQNSGIREIHIAELFQDMGLLGGVFERSGKSVLFTVGAECQFRVERQENIRYN